MMKNHEPLPEWERLILSLSDQAFLAPEGKAV